MEAHTLNNIHVDQNYNIEKNTDWKGIFCSYIKNHSGHLYSLILKIYIQLPIKIEEKIEELKQALKIIEEKNSLLCLPSFYNDFDTKEKALHFLYQTADLIL